MSHLVFVYGSLRQGMGNHRVLGDAEFLGNATIEGWAMVSLGAYPAIYRCDGLSVIGEVYRCDDLTFARLDLLEGYPSFYNRSQVATAWGDAWVYHFEGSKVKGLPAVVGGDWVCA